jgi:hypothetical protein
MHPYEYIRFAFRITFYKREVFFVVEIVAVKAELKLAIPGGNPCTAQSSNLDVLHGQNTFPGGSPCKVTVGIIILDKVLRGSFTAPAADFPSSMCNTSKNIDADVFIGEFWRRHLIFYPLGG